MRFSRQKAEGKGDKEDKGKDREGRGEVLNILLPIILIFLIPDSQSLIFQNLLDRRIN